MPLKIDQVWIFIADDEEGEGVVGFKAGNQWMPLVAADEARVESLRQVAENVAQVSNTKITLAKFSVRQNLEIISPVKGGVKTERI